MASANSIPIERVLAALASYGCDPISRGNGQHEARCPVHRGSRKNLSVAEAEDGRVLVNCFHADQSGRGCSAEEIVHALGLEMRDLFPGRRRGSTNGAEG